MFHATKCLRRCRHALPPGSAPAARRTNGCESPVVMTQKWVCAPFAVACLSPLKKALTVCYYSGKCLLSIIPLAVK